ncbi:hypothetical protein [Bosea minatitlanensis]|uniref:Transcriptional regulator n=1 Tax=Bosea minatitlanensis TaxID=128782 RepID=A0ABW0F193_9HYPH|nr:hypothetical protein [Bosea minatitlanensis]MCT4492090.1 hypothetical protein [Bosea minatitlanensis]
MPRTGIQFDTPAVLTGAGFALAKRIVVPHVATEERLVGALSPAERAELRRLLAKIGRSKSR